MYRMTVSVSSGGYSRKESTWRQRKAWSLKMPERKSSGWWIEADAGERWTSPDATATMSSNEAGGIAYDPPASGTARINREPHMQMC